ncbi:MAG: restriction endonuclease subunit S [Endomicrobiaceae bacterium]|nr:restriction endonuclease subunit S [Endomicrobiaceae bacterium]
MKNNWKEVKLGDVCNITRGASPRPIHDYLSAYGLPWIKISDATDDSSRFINKTKEFIKEEGRSKTRWLQKGAFILSNSATPGIPKILKIDACVHDGWLIFNFDNKIIDKWFLYYLCLILRTSLVGLADGTVFRNLKTDIVKNFPISLPPLEEQKRIAEILSSFDDKIELLQKQNKTLADMAKAIFKSWFVDFDIVKAKERREKKSKILNEYKITEEIYNLFPDSFEDSELGKIPKSWEVKKIKDIGTIVCGKTPPTIDKSNYGCDIPFITIPDMHNQLFILKTERKLSKKGANSQIKKILPAFSICISCIATPGLIVMTSENSQTNQQINSVIPNNTKASFYFYNTLQQIINKIKSNGSGGSVFNNLNKTQFETIDILVANNNLQNLFSSEIDSMYKKILSNLKQIQTLIELRDSLLPKLISGAILY